MLACSDVELTYNAGKIRQKVLDRLSLTVQPGQIVSLLGPSGCGKSTLLKVLAGLVTPNAGQAEIDGQSVFPKMPPSIREKISFVFQEPALLPWRTVWQNVILPNELRGRRSPEILERVGTLLELVGFRKSDWKKLPSQLSGGMKMRASIARAMSTQPTILLLDEPFAALDDMLRSKLNDLLLEISSRQHCTMLFVTHNIAEAIYLSHEIAIMSHGRIADRLTVPLEFPRSAAIRSEPEFARFFGQVSDALFQSHP